MGWRGNLGGVAVDLGTASMRVAGSLTRHILEVPAHRDGRRALSAGVVADVDLAAELLRPLLRQARAFGFLPSRVVASAPTDAGAEDRERLIAALRAAGARGVVVFPEPLSAAIGGGVDVGSAYAQMVVDVGHGVTDALVVREPPVAP